MRNFSSLITFIILVGCGSSSDAPSDLCSAICDRDKMCSAATSCDPACPGFQDQLRPEVRDAMAACYDTLACGAGDDRCLQDGLDAAPARAIDDSFRTQCLDTVSTCGLNDDVCSLSPLFELVHVQAAVACLDRPCDQVDSCLAEALSF